MKNTILTLLLAIMVSYNSETQAPTLKPWKAAQYHELVVGTSSRDDVLKALGKPKAVAREQDTGLPTMTYQVLDPVPGKLVVYTSNGVLDGITLLPKNHLTRSDALRLFGPDYAIVRYATDDCLTEGGTAPIYESPAGSIKHIEYRDRGVAVILHDGEVEAVVFVSKPFGPAHSLCAARRKK